MGIGVLASRIPTNSVSAVSVAQFASRLAKICSSRANKQSPQNGIRQRKIGLAISGGVDSMALALLCSRVNSYLSAKDGGRVERGAEVEPYQFQAFIVDHGAREGSDAEALAVANVLQSRGIAAEILRLKWESGDFHRDNFESAARRSRFQLLGKACRNHGIESLCLAHHQDDQVETVLMRMINGHRLQGLTGIKFDSEIPECYGLYGIHESGTAALRHKNWRKGSSRVTRLDEKRLESEVQEPLAFESGGIKVYRPLLDFTKSELKKTCEDADMEWFEDRTNKDPTLTARNAIRHMYEYHSLPIALTKESILALCERANQRTSVNTGLVDKWLHHCKISRFETRSGLLQISFPDILLEDLDGISSAQRLHIASLLIRNVVKLITPNEHVELSTLANIVVVIFPDLFNNRNDSQNLAWRQTAAGVQFDLTPDLSANGRPQWQISRQIPQRNQQRPLLTFPGHNHAPENTSLLWQLFDGRYWTSLRHCYDTPLSMEILCKEQIAPFLRNLQRSERIRLKKVMKSLAPGNVRWTLPAIVHKGNVLALPTLGFITAEARGMIDWEIRYKKVDLRELSMSFLGGEL